MSFYDFVTLDEEKRNKMLIDSLGKKKSVE
jgi:hypothetical protein